MFSFRSMISKATTNENKTKFPETNEPTNQQKPKPKPAQKNLNKHFIKSNIVLRLGAGTKQKQLKFLAQLPVSVPTAPFLLSDQRSLNQSRKVGCQQGGVIGKSPFMSHQSHNLAAIDGQKCLCGSLESR